MAERIVLLDATEAVIGAHQELIWSSCVKCRAWRRAGTRAPGRATSKIAD